MEPFENKRLYVPFPLLEKRDNERLEGFVENNFGLLSDFVTNSFGESWDSSCEKS